MARLAGPLRHTRRSGSQSRHARYFLAGLWSRARDTSPLAQICARVDYVSSLQEHLKDDASEEMRTELKEIQRAVGITTLFVTHDQHQALGLSDRIAVMNAGRIEQLGTPREVYERPATRFVADFIGASTVLEARALEARAVEIAGGLRIDVRLPRSLVPGEHVRLLIRPERVELGEDRKSVV